MARPKYASPGTSHQPQLPTSSTCPNRKPGVQPLTPLSLQRANLPRQAFWRQAVAWDFLQNACKPAGHPLLVSTSRPPRFRCCGSLVMGNVRQRCSNSAKLRSSSILPFSRLQPTCFLSHSPTWDSRQYAHTETRRLYSRSPQTPFLPSTPLSSRPVYPPFRAPKLLELLWKLGRRLPHHQPRRYVSTFSVPSSEKESYLSRSHTAYRNR